MFDALVTAQGKPESRLRLLFTGTLAPSKARDGGRTWSMSGTHDSSLCRVPAGR